MYFYNIKNFSLYKRKINSQIKIKIKKFNYNLLKIYLSGEGCMGFKYNFINSKLIKNYNIYIIKNKKNFLIDFITFFYIYKSKLKIKKDKIIIKNNNIKNYCNCKTSFNFL